jgi:hypothetical protein
MLGRFSQREQQLRAQLKEIENGRRQQDSGAQWRVEAEARAHEGRGASRGHGAPQRARHTVMETPCMNRGLPSHQDSVQYPFGGAVSEIDEESEMDQSMASVDFDTTSRSLMPAPTANSRKHERA